MTGRYELKYVIDPERRARFLAAARPGLQPDPHGDNAVYRVSSVYFDTPDFAAYWEKLDGEARRRKYRLRYYHAGDCHTGDPDRLFETAFMEIKHRINNTVYKQRMKVTRGGALAILNDDRELRNLHRHLDRTVEPDRSAVMSVEAAAGRGLQAKATVTYLREAWLGRVDDRLRVTFDSRGRTLSPELYAGVGSNQGRRFMPDNQVILEVKFNRSVPRWLRDILDQQHLVLQRFSKYASSVEAPAARYFRSISRDPESRSESAPGSGECERSTALPLAGIGSGSPNINASQT